MVNGHDHLLIGQKPKPQKNDGVQQLHSEVAGMLRDIEVARVQGAEACALLLMRAAKIGFGIMLDPTMTPHSCAVCLTQEYTRTIVRPLLQNDIRTLRLGSLFQPAYELLATQEGMKNVGNLPIPALDVESVDHTAPADTDMAHKPGDES